jgi:multidrug efflux pump subunit AcrA (membrane-fusion protein)
LAKTHAVSQLDYDKAQLQVAASQSQVEVLEKSLADLKSTLDFSAQTAHIQLDIQKELERDYTVKAMAPGVLLEVSKQAGELARRGELLARIGAGPLLARLYVAEEDINGVRVGQEVFLHLNTEPERAFRASVSRIYPAFDEREQSFVVEAAFAEAPAQLWPGTQVQANIVAARRPQALTLPRACLLPGDRVRLAGGEEVALSIGVRTQEWVEVLSGLDEGAEVLVSN